MRLHLYCLFLLFIVLAAPASAQLNDTMANIPRNVLAVDVGGITIDAPGIVYYRAISPRSGLGLRAAYLYHPIGSETVTGVQAGLIYNFYPAAKALWRFHWSALGGYQRVAASADRTADGPVAGIFIGWQWFPEGVLAVGFNAGLTYRVGKPDDAVLAEAFGLKPLLSFELGYAWR